MAVNTFGGDTNNNGGFIDGAGFVYTDGYPMPTMNPCNDGARPISVSGVSLDYLSNGNAAINYQGVETASSNFLSSGGTFRAMARNSSGRMYFGRNTGNGYNTYSSAGGSPWGGGLSGQFYFAGAPSAPVMGAPVAGPAGSVHVAWAAPADTGDLPLTRYVLQWSSDPAFGAGTQQVTTGALSADLSLTPGRVYYFRVGAGNALSDAFDRVSAWSNVPSVLTRSGGKVRVAGAWRPGIAQVRVAGAWRPGVVKVRTGGAWRDAQ